MSKQYIGGQDMQPVGLGHNIRGQFITIETRLFNSLSKFAGQEGPFRTLSLPAGSTIGDVIRALSVPLPKVYLVLRNGRDVTRSLYDEINTEAVLDEGDVVALSGPVPYSWGYGAPVV